MEIIGWLKGSGSREGYHGRAELTDPDYEAPSLVDDEASDPESNLSWDPRGIQLDSSRHTSPSSVRTVNSGQIEPRDGSPAVLHINGTTKAFSSILPSMIPEQMKPREQGDSALNNSKMYKAFDEFGFVKEEDETMVVMPAGVLQKEEDQKLKWLAYFEFTQNVDMGELTWDKVGSVLPRSDRLLSLVKAGIPHSLRPHVWKRLTGSLKKKDESQTSYKQILRKALIDNSSVSAKQIEKDLLRTMPNNACFSSTSSVGVKRLQHVLRALADFFPEMGYCQGTGMLAGMLLLLMEEEDVFWMMVAIIEEVLPESYYNKTLMGVQVDQKVLKQLVSTIVPNIYQLFKEHDTDITLVTLHWFITAYAAVVPTQVLLRIWDIFFCEGSISLFRIAVGILKQQEDELVHLENSAAIFNCVSDAPSKVTVLNIDDLIESAFHLTLSMNDDVLRVQRQVHLGELQKELGEQMVSPGKRKQSLSTSMEMQTVRRRFYSVERQQSGFLSSLFGLLIGDRKPPRPKNIKQTELVTDLHEAIMQIAQHFHKDSVEVMSPDYSLQSHIHDHEIYIHSALASKKVKRGRAVVDFEAHDVDELGFRKNDIIKIISQRDDHCWIGEMNGKRGWFPARFVHLLDERSKQYSFAGDDSISDDVSDLVRGRLCRALRALCEHGLKKPYMFGGAVHPWHFIEEVSEKEVSSDFRSVYARLVLCKTYNLEADGKVLTADEMLYRTVQMINMSHDAVGAQLDVKFRSWVCAGLNEQVLHLWLETLCSSEETVRKWYNISSYIRSPGWVQLKCELRILASFSFNLSIDWEIDEERQVKLPIQESVRDMLVKHHLFSWDL